MVARMLGGVGRTLITAGTLILLFVVYQLWGTGLQEAKAQDQLDREFAARLEQVQATSTTTTVPPTTTTTAPPTGTTQPGDLEVIEREEVQVSTANIPLPEEGEPVATIKIPKIGVTRQVVEGVTLDQLKRGPGHYPETPLPGQAGNASIAGHRTTYGQPFHNVDKLADGDIIQVETVQGNFEYEIDGITVVKPNQSEVLLDTFVGDTQVLENRITLTACHPKWSARERIVVTGLLVGKPVPPYEGQVEARQAAAETKRDEGNEATIDGGLSGVQASKTPAILWGLACAAVWLLTWLGQVLLRRLVRRRAAAEAVATEPVAPNLVGTGADDDLWSTPGDPLSPSPAARPTPVRPSRGLRLLTWSPYVVGLPVFLVTLYVFFENFARLLPGNY